HLSEAIRFHKLRMLAQGMFVDEGAQGELLEAYSSWYADYAMREKLPDTPDRERLKSKLFECLSRHTYYLLDGKALLCGRVLQGEITGVPTSLIPTFRGSLLDATTYIHMRDPILQSTEGIVATIGTTGLKVQVQTRKHSLTLDMVKLLKVGKVF